MLHASANRRSLAVILVCAFATGCVHRPVYGESWAKQVIVESGACPVIDGDYQNAGERFLKAKHHTYERQNVSLAHLLDGWVSAKRIGRVAFNPAEDAYQSVSLRLAEGKLHIRASRADGSTRAFDLPTRQQCRDSILLLEKGWGDSGTMLYFSLVERSALGLGRAEDGSLLVRQSASGVGFVMWLPISVDTEAFWFRFPPVAPSPADAESPPEAVQPGQTAGALSGANETSPLFMVVQDGKFGFIDKTGTMIIAPQFSGLEESSRVFPEGLAAVMTGGKFGHIDMTKWGFIDKTGTMVIAPQFAGAYGFSEGLAVVAVMTGGGKKGGYIDKTGQMVILPQYDGALSFKQGLAAVMTGGKWGYIDKTGTMVIAPQFSDAWGFSEGLAPVKTGGKWGFIDKSGQMIIPPRYSERHSPFSEGLAAVKTGGKWGFIDKSGQMVIPPRYSEANSFYEGLVDVKNGRSWGYIDKTGKYVWVQTK